MKTPKCCQKKMTAFAVTKTLSTDIILFQCQKCKNIKQQEYDEDN